MSGETLENRCHAQNAFPGEDLPLKGHMPIYPRLGQRASPTVKTSHPTEGQKRWSGKEFSQIRVREPKALRRFPPYSFLARDRQWRIDSVQAIQSINRSQSVQSYQGREYPKQQ